MIGKRATTGLSLCLAALATPAAPAQRLAVSDEVRAELLGALTYTRLSVRLDEAPTGDAIRALSRAIGVNIIGRFVTERIDHGIDPNAPITLAIDDADGRLVLEMILEQCADLEPCTWQLRNGFIEVGTKERLSAATNTRMYPIRDFVLEPPYFYTGTRGGDTGDGPGDTRDFLEHPYHCAALTRPVPSRQAGYIGGPVGRPHGEARKGPELLAQEMVQAIVQTIEPGNWDYGQFTDDAESEASGEKRIDTRRTRRTPEGQRKIARLRLIGDRLVITAPDFIHRQVNGYPRPTRPRQLTPEELQERSAKASTERARIVVLGNAPMEPGRRSP